MRKARAHAALLVALGLAGSIAPAFAACDGALAEMLHPVLHPHKDARAYWLDAATIRWPSQPREGRYRLVSSASAALQVRTGKLVGGADADHVLQPAMTLPSHDPFAP